ncbi:MAG: FAD-dependent oxidoreductase, partial [Candidatus Omnitrophica bacterium]|nr:FAD-dependent oxidoreductase [Candidatus Omnitrophota bacterium]
MPKTKIVIAGGGFAGISALKTLSKRSERSKRSIEITIIDKKPYSEFLPMLPDVAGGWLRPELLRTDLRRIAASAGAVFAQEEITGLDTAAGSLRTREREILYDFLILATGSETNFYANDVLSRKCLRLDTVEDAVSIREKVLQRGKSGEVNIVISGAGYTGVELASNLDILLKEKGVQHNVSIVEKADEALMMLPGWVRREVMEELGKMGIEILTGTSIREYDGSTAVLSSGEKVDNALCVWAAGVKTPSYVEASSLPKERSRILVEE